LGPFDEGIDLGSTASSTVDRCFVQLVYLAKAAHDSFGVRAAKILNSTIQHVDCKIDQSANADGKTNYGFYGTQYVTGCKIINITGAAIIGIFGNSKIIDSAVVNYTLSGIISGGNNVNSVLRSNLDITGCAIYEVSTAGHGSANDIKFKVIHGGSSGEIKNNHIGHVFLDFNATGTTLGDTFNNSVSAPAVETPVVSMVAAAGNPPTTYQQAYTHAALNDTTYDRATETNLLWQNKSLNIELVTGAQQHQNNRIDSIYVELGSYKLGKATIFSNAGTINNNYVGSFDMTADYKDFYTFELFALAWTNANGSITNNVFDQINVEVGRRLAGKFYCFGNAKIVQNNRVSSFKLKDFGKHFVDFQGNLKRAAFTTQAAASYQPSSIALLTRQKHSEQVVTAEAKLDQVKTANFRSLIGILVTLDQSIIDSNSFGLLFSEKKQYDMPTNTTVFGILNDTTANVRATIKNNYFKNISVLGQTGAPVETYANLFTPGDNLSAFGIYVKGGALVHTIDNNELNVECLVKQNAKRDATGYTLEVGGGYGIYVNNLYHVIKNNIVSVKGQAKKLSCIENAVSATATQKGDLIPNADCENNTISLENLSAADQQDIMIKNIHRLKGTKLREGRYNTITSNARIYVTSWTTAVSKTEQVKVGEHVDPLTNETIEDYEEQVVVAPAIAASNTSEGGNNELPFYYHVYATTA
jgi:hypothetical protein